MLKRLLALAAMATLGSCSLAFDVDAVFLGHRLAFVLANDNDDPGRCGAAITLGDANGPVYEVELGEPFGRRGADCPDLFPLFWGEPPLGEPGRPPPRLELGRVYMIGGYARGGSINGAFIAERRGDRIFVDNLVWEDPRRQAAERHRWPPRPEKDEKEGQEQLNAR